MKELSIEEKAKAYDEALEYAHYLINECCKEGTDGSFHRADLQKMFPTLAESEDENIRKDILAFIKRQGQHIDKYKWSKWIAWLEKQGETFTKKDVDDAYLKGISDAKQELEKQGEQKPTIEMKTPEESLGIDSDTYNKIVDECVYDEQKPAWSKEDEKIYQSIMDDTVQENQLDGKQINWLQSLKDRYTWKPSDLPHWQKSNLPNDNTTGFNSDYFCHKGYIINYKELFEKLPKDD